MTALAAFLSRSGDPTLATEKIRSILSRMPARSRDGQCITADGRAALGHGLIRLSAVDQVGPWRLRRDGPILTGTIRLWNRETLGIALGNTSATDPQLVLLAYDRWGPDFGVHLQGDFAFALWVPEEQRLFCLRDVIGVRSLFYRATADGFGCATEPEALVGLAPTSVDMIWVAEYLSDQVTDGTRTGWGDILRLGPGERLIASPQGHAIDRFADISVTRPHTLPSKDVPDALREAMTHAVRVRASEGNIGALLSGGLDSSSIALLAERLLGPGLPVFTQVYPDYPTMDEVPHQRAVLAAGQFRAYQYREAPAGIFDSIDTILAEQQLPYGGYGISGTRHLLREAAEAGVSVLLDGHGGDEVNASGIGRLNELASSGQYGQLLSGINSAAPQYGISRGEFMLDVLSASARHRVLRGAARRLSGRPDPFAWRRLVDADLARTTALVERVREAHSGQSSSGPDEAEFLQHRKLLTSQRMQLSFELMDRAAAGCGIEQRYPFLDIDVINLCLGQPAREKFRDGLPRSMLRRAMIGILPESVRLRRDKVNFLPVLIDGLRRDRTGRIDELRHGRIGALEGLVNVTALRDAIARIDGDGEAPDLAAAKDIWRSVILKAWLEQNNLETASCGRLEIA